MDITREEIYKICKRFREAVQKTSLDVRPASFQRFPQGSCGCSCLILGAFLSKKGLDNICYVCGQRKRYSHAWLTWNNLIIDITGDQFSDFSTAVFVGSKSKFHGTFEIVNCHPANASLDGKSIKTDRLWLYYQKVMEEY